jgi:hypothetical protein
MGRLALTTAVIFTLVACSGSGTGAVPVGAMAQPYAHRDSGTDGDLLYVTDSGADYSGAYVQVYTYPQGKHVATLTGFRRLLGECSDANGDVFVVAPGFQYSDPTKIYEYAHGGSQPIATLSESGEGYSCAADPTTGNLAVANYADVANPYMSGRGDVAIFAGAQGNPEMHYSSTLNSFWYCGYDDKGNLYLSGRIIGGYGYELASLRAGTSGSVETVNMNISLHSAPYLAPSVQWDGSNVTVSSTRQQIEFGETSGLVTVYRLKISGGNATVIGTTKLDATPERHRGQSWIQGSTIIGINYDDGHPYVTFWNYPKGGKPTRQIRHKQFRGGSVFFGVTVSVAPSGPRIGK